jgi:peptidyl-prolyl cis-trans isomerase SurA
MRWLLILGLATAPAIAAPVGAVAVIDRPAATVDTEVLWQSQVDERIASSGGAVTDRAKLIAEMIDDMLIMRGADEMKVEVDSKEIDEALIEIKKQNSINDAQLDAELKKIPMTLATYRQELGRQIRQFRFMNQAFRPKVNIGDADVDAKIKELGIKPADADRDAVRAGLVRTKVDALKATWLAERRKAARIVVAR